MKTLNPTYFLAIVLAAILVSLVWIAARGSDAIRIPDTFAVTVDDTGTVALSDDLPELPAGRIYELWIVGDDGSTHSAGLMEGTRAAAVTLRGRIRQWLAPGASIVITVESSGGAPGGKPTGRRIYSGRLVSAVRG
ncbi:anti-sigma factor domain-containing protein [Dongia sp.]|uniref:anti-sigma factor domain-containing protein n=1 Tax=Dongia sp. TaxID=1977262 RepID=UPI0035AD9BE1